MKKYVAILIALMLMLSMTACGSEPAAPAATESTAPAAPIETAAPAPTEEPAPVEPAWEPGIARARFGEVLFTNVELDTEVKVVGKLDAYYVVSVPGHELELLVDEFAIRLQDEDAFEAYVGYSHSGTKVFTDAYMDGEEIAELKLNTEVNVVDGKANWLRIEWEDQYGYVDAENISKHRIVYYEGGGSGGGGGGADGSDVFLGGLSAFVQKKPTLSLLSAYCGPEYEKLESDAVVIIHDARLYLHLTDRGDELKVTKVGDDVCEIYMDGYTATVPRWLVKMAEDADYEEWTGYAKYGTVSYAEYQMRTEIDSYKLNDELHVIDELPTCYVVDMDGQIGYILLDNISENKIYYAPGGGGGGSGGGDWTPPAL